MQNKDFYNDSDIQEVVGKLSDNKKNYPSIAPTQNKKNKVKFNSKIEYVSVLELNAYNNKFYS